MKDGSHSIVVDYAELISSSIIPRDFSRTRASPFDTALEKSSINLISTFSSPLNTRNRIFSLPDRSQLFGYSFTDASNESSTGFYSSSTSTTTTTSLITAITERRRRLRQKIWKSEMQRTESSLRASSVPPCCMLANSNFKVSAEYHWKRTTKWNTSSPSTVTIDAKELSGAMTGSISSYLNSEEPMAFSYAIESEINRKPPITHTHQRNSLPDYASTKRSPQSTTSSGISINDDTISLPLERQALSQNLADESFELLFLPPTGVDGPVPESIAFADASFTSSQGDVEEEYGTHEKNEHRNQTSTTQQPAVSKMHDIVICSELSRHTEDKSSNRATGDVPIQELKMTEIQRIETQKWSSWLKASVRLANKRRTLVAGKTLFNMNPRQGIDYLINAGVIANNTHAITNFLEEPNLSSTAIGEYFGRLSDPVAALVTSEFVSRLNFKNLSIDEALRCLLYRIHPSGESQKLEFLLRHFKETYVLQNPDRVSRQFKNPETIYTLVYAIVMLQTDLHNPNVRKHSRPMTCDGFVANLSGVDDGANLDEEMLRSIYNHVAAAELKTYPDVIDQLRLLDTMLISSTKIENFVSPYRRFIGWTAAYEVFDVSRCRSLIARPKSHLRGLFVFNDLLVMAKPIRGYATNAVNELLGTTNTPRASSFTDLNSLQSPPSSRRFRSIDLFGTNRPSFSSGMSSGPGAGRVNFTIPNEMQRRQRYKNLPGGCSTDLPVNSTFQVRQVIPLIDVQVLVFSSGVYANGVQLRGHSDETLVYVNMPTNEIRQKLIHWLHESIEEIKELSQVNYFRKSWPWSPTVHPTSLV